MTMNTNYNNLYKNLQQNQMIGFTNAGTSPYRYDLEYIFNKVKDIGKLVQLIRIERKNIIYGDKIFKLLLEIVGEESLNKSLLLETSNYTWNMDVINVIINRISSADLDDSVYPDYFMNNIVKMFNSTDLHKIDLLTLIHLALDIGQLEYSMDKYQINLIPDCYPKLIFDLAVYENIFTLISNIGQKFKSYYKTDLPIEKKYYPSMLIKEVVNLSNLYGSEFVIQFSKYSINKEKVKYFFEHIMRDELTNASVYNLTISDSFEEKVYKIIYANLRNDYLNYRDNPSCEYILNITYRVLFTLHDFLILPENKITVKLDKIIDLDFYLGCLANSLINIGQTVLTYLFNKLMYFDLASKNLLLNVMTYLKADETIPNIIIAEELENVYNKIAITNFTMTTNPFDINESNIKYCPIECKKLFCLIKPKQETNINILSNKLTDIANIFNNSNLDNINGYYEELKNKYPSLNINTVTSVITSNNDLKILGIREESKQIDPNNIYHSTNQQTQPTNQQTQPTNQQTQPTNQQTQTQTQTQTQQILPIDHNFNNMMNLPVSQNLIPNSNIILTGGKDFLKYYLKYIKYKSKYIGLKLNNSNIK